MAAPAGPEADLGVMHSRPPANQQRFVPKNLLSPDCDSLGDVSPKPPCEVTAGPAPTNPRAAAFPSSSLCLFPLSCKPPLWFQNFLCARFPEPVSMVGSNQLVLWGPSPVTVCFPTSWHRRGPERVLDACGHGSICSDP